MQSSLNTEFDDFEDNLNEKYEDLLLRFRLSQAEYWEEFMHKGVATFYNNCMEPIRETLMKQLYVYIDCQATPARELARLNHTQKVTRLEAEKRRLQEQIIRLK